MKRPGFIRRLLAFRWLWLLFHAAAFVGGSGASVYVTTDANWSNVQGQIALLIVGGIAAGVLAVLLCALTLTLIVRRVLNLCIDVYRGKRLEAGDRVLVMNEDGEWLPGRVVEQHVHIPDTYLVWLSTSRSDKDQRLLVEGRQIVLEQSLR